MSTATAHRRAKLSGWVAAQVMAAAPAPTRLEIAELTAFPIREPVSRRAYTILRIRTRNGITGYGEGPLTAPTDLAAARQFWTGKPATAYASVAPESPLSGAVDMALLDIVGKSCKAPVYRVLGGPTRTKARAFASVAISDLSKAAAAGYRAFGIALPAPAARNQGQAYQRDLRNLLNSVRQSPTQDFILEAQGLLTPGDAASVAATIEPMHPLWFDQPCEVSNVQAIRKIADESVVPLGFTGPGFQNLLRESLVDILRPDIAREGITAIRRMAAMAETYYVAVAPRHHGGPIATAAALHLAASLPNFFIQQIPFSTAAEDAAMRAALAGPALEHVRDGFATLPTGPGLGVTINESALEKYHAA